MTLDDYVEEDLSVPLCRTEGCNKRLSHDGKCMFYKKSFIDDLPNDVVYTIQKTGETRGANSDRSPYQNRVPRNSRAVVPLEFREVRPKDGYQDGFTIMVRPDEYFDPKSGERRDDFPDDILIGEDAFMYYADREDWENYHPDNYDWEPCSYIDSDGNPADSIGDVEHIGDYVARIDDTNSDEDSKIKQGKIQGIRFFEYANEKTRYEAYFQLAYLAWKTEGMEELAGNENIDHLLAILEENELLKTDRLREINAIEDGKTICPLCRETIHAMELTDRVSQTKGRESRANTITKANLWHINELKPGKFNHKPYNLAWGHHHCNMIVGESSIEDTLDMLEKVLMNNDRM